MRESFQLDPFLKLVQLDDILDSVRILGTFVVPEKSLDARESQGVTDALGIGSAGMQRAAGDFIRSDGDDTCRLHPDVWSHLGIDPRRSMLEGNGVQSLPQLDPFFIRKARAYFADRPKDIGRGVICRGKNGSDPEPRPLAAPAEIADQAKIHRIRQLPLITALEFDPVKIAGSRRIG